MQVYENLALTRSLLVRTCRKRRIKCGEEKPQCANCIKSKRPCELSKQPIRYVHNPSQSEGSPLPLAPQANVHPLELAPMRSRHDSQQLSPGTSSYPDTVVSPTLEAGSATTGYFNFAQQQQQQQHRLHHTAVAPRSSLSWPEPPQSSYGRTHSLAGTVPDSWQSNAMRMSQDQAAAIDPLLAQLNPRASLLSTDEDLLTDLHSSTDAARLPYHSSFQGPTIAAPSHHPHYFPSRSGHALDSHSPDGIDANAQHNPGEYGTTQHMMQGWPDGWSGLENHIPNAPWENLQVSQSLDPSHVAAAATGAAFSGSYGFGRPAFGQIGLTQFLDEAAVAVQDDDYYDVASNESADAIAENMMFDDGSVDRDLDAIVSLTKHSMSLAISHMADPARNIYPGFTMAEYLPERSANPLRNPYTQRVFAHFVFSTGPMLSFLQQRNRPASLRDSSPGSASYTCQGLWTYLMAMMALHDQGLLHSMLAMASYHIAKLEHGSVTPSLKHYSYAIKNVHRSVNSKGGKRHHVTTLAATLLLAFYEVIKADHRAWSTHLAGAMQLIKELDYPNMTAHIKYLKAKDLYRTTLEYSDRDDQNPGSIIHLLFPDVDMTLINHLSGGEGTLHSQHGGCRGDIPSTASFPDLPDSKLREYQVFQDLFWYACRHDVIHALVGGNKLLYVPAALFVAISRLLTS